MSIAFLDSSIENQNGGYIKPDQIKLLKIHFSMSGTFIVSEWHFVSLGILLSISSTAFSTFSPQW